MQKLIDTFNTFGKISDENIQRIMEAIMRKEYSAKTILQDADKISSKIYFVEKGIARTFYYKDGKDVTFWIALEGDFIGSMSSFFMREPSIKMIETLEDCVLWEFEYQKLEKLFSSNSELEKLGRLFSNYGLSLMEKRFDNLHFNTAKERYQILVKQDSEIIQRISLGIIASYLGVTQETLSRIRSQK